MIGRLFFWLFHCHKWKHELLKTGQVTDCGSSIGEYYSYKLTCEKCGHVKYKKKTLTVYD